MEKDEIARAEIGLNDYTNNQSLHNSKDLISSRKIKWSLIIPIILILSLGIGFAIGEIFDLGTFVDIFGKQENLSRIELTGENKYDSYTDDIFISKIKEGNTITERRMLAISSEVKNVYEDNKWKMIEDARSLKDSGIGFGNIKTDSRYGYEIADFNYTSITFYPILKDSKEINKDISFKKDDVVKGKFNYDNINQRQQITFYGDILRSNFTVGDNSTTFSVNGTGNNGRNSPVSTQRGATAFTNFPYVTMGTDTLSDYVARLVLNFSLVALPQGSTVISANLSVYKTTDFSDLLGNFTYTVKNGTFDLVDVSASDNFVGWVAGNTAVYGGINMTYSYDTGTNNIMGGSYFNTSFNSDGISVIQAQAGRELKLMMMSAYDLSGSLVSGRKALEFGNPLAQAPLLFVEYQFVTINPTNPAFNATLNSTNVLTNNTNVNLTINFNNQDSTGLANITMNWYENESAMLVLNMPFTTNSTNVKDYSGFNNNGTISGALWQRYLNEDNNSLVLLMPFDEDNSTTAIDSSDYKNHGVLSGVTLITGITGNAYNFIKHQLTNINVSDKNELSFSGTPFTLEAWVLPKGTATGLGILAKGDGSGATTTEYVLEIDGSGGTNRLELFYNGAWRAGSNNKIIRENWNHVVATSNGTNVTFYINGQLDTSINSVGSYATDLTYALTIGRQGQASNFFNGSIDNVRIYNKALTSSEIQDHYNKYKLYYSPSFKFDGVRNSINITQNFNTSGQFSIETWIYANGSAPMDILNSLSTQNNLGEYQFRFRPDLSGKIEFFRRYAQGSTSISFYRTDTLLSNNQWYHVVATYNNSLGNTASAIWINGVRDTTTNTTSATTSTLPPQTRIGLNDVNANSFSGSITQVRIWNRSLSANQIFELYNSYNKTAFNLVGNELTSGFTYYAQVTVANSSGIGNLSIATNNITILGGGATFAVNPRINSTYALNYTNETLFAIFTPSSLGGSSQKANITWFNSSNNINFFSRYTEGGASVTQNIPYAFSLNVSNTTRNEYWLAMVTLYDGGAFIRINTSSLFIINYPPYNQTLDNPKDNLMTSNYTLSFNTTRGYDEDGDSINYEFYIDREVNPPTTLNYNNTNNEVNYTLGADGRYYWRVRLNDNQSVSSFAPTRSFLVDRRFITNISLDYNISSFQGTNQTFAVTIVFNQSTVLDVNATLKNNTLILGTSKIIINSNTIKFITSRLTPSTDTQYAWNFTILSINNSITYNSTTSFIQTTNIHSVYDCSGGGSNASSIIIYNFTLRNEENESILNGDWQGSFIRYFNTLSINNSFNLGLKSNITNVLICSSPADATFFVNSQISYNGLSLGNGLYAQDPRQYFLSKDLAGATVGQQNISLYLLDYFKATAVTFTVQDTSAIGIQGVILKISRLNSGNNTYKVVAMGKTDNNGNTVIFVRNNDVTYRGIAIFPDMSIVDFGDAIFSGITHIYQSSLSNPLSDLQDTAGVQTNIAFDNSTNIFTATFNDINQKISSGCFEITQASNNGSIAVIYNQCILGTSGVFSVAVGNSTASYYSALYANGSPTDILAKLAVFVNNAIQGLGLGVEGLSYSLLIILFIMLLGVWKPEISIALSLLGIIISVIFGLWIMALTTLFGIIISGMLLIWRLNRR